MKKYEDQNSDCGTFFDKAVQIKVLSGVFQFIFHKLAQNLS